MISSKHGQPSSYSPNTQNLNRRRMGGLFSTSASSPLATVTSQQTLLSGDEEGDMDTPGYSPTKAGPMRNGGTGRTYQLSRRSFSRSLTADTDTSSCSREDEGCFVLSTSKVGDIVAEVATLNVQKGEGAEMNGMAQLPDEIILKIISHLPRTARQLACVSRVSRRFAELARANRFWSEVYYDTCGYDMVPSVRHRIQPTNRAPPGCWTHEGWIWRDEKEQDEQVEEGLLTEGLRILAEQRSAGQEGNYEEEDSGGRRDIDSAARQTPSKMTSTPVKFKSHRSRTAPIPVHYPTLVRSRTTLSRLLRNPSPLHRHSIETLDKHADSVYCLHAVGRWLITGSRDRSIRLWRLGAFGPTGQMRRTRLIKTIHDAHQGSVLSVHFELDEGTGKGTLVAASSDMSTSVWDLDFSLERASGGAARDGQGDGVGGSVVEANSGTTRAPTITRRYTLKGHTAGVLDALLTPDHIVSGSKDSTIRVYSRSSGQLVHVLQGHIQPVNCLAARPVPKLSRPTDGSSSSDTAGKGQEQVVSAGADGRWIVWDLATGQEVRQRTSSSGLACIAWQGDYIVTGDNDHLVSVYDAKTFELLRTLKGHEDLIRTIDINLQEGVVVSGGYDQKIIIWDLYTGEMLRKIASQHTSLVFDLQATTTRLISASHDKSIQVFSLVTGLPYLDIMA